MLFILRLTNGNCVILLASDEQNARQSLKQIDYEDGEIASVRALDRFGVHLSPTEDGSLEILNWDDRALDSILEREYPFLHRAFQEANARAFEQPGTHEPAILRLNAEFERGAEIMRRAIRVERERCAPKADSAHN